MTNRNGEAGNAVIPAIFSIVFSTFITLSLLGLSFSAYNTLLIRDAAITAANKAALKNSSAQDRYLLKLLQDNLPDLASYSVRGFGDERILGIEITGVLPGFGSLPAFNTIDVKVAATRENLL